MTTERITRDGVKPGLFQTWSQVAAFVAAGIAGLGLFGAVALVVWMLLGE